MEGMNCDEECKRPVVVNLCGNCGKSGELQCSRCKNVHYCSGDCQKAQWKTHKSSCVPFRKDGEWPALVPLGKKGGMNTLTRSDAMAKARAIDPVNAVTVCSRCNKPTACMSASEMKLPMANSSGCSATAMFMCADGHTSFVSDARMGSEQNCNCKIDVVKAELELSDDVLAAARSSVSASMRLLVVIGCGAVTIEESCYLNNLKPLLKKLNLSYDVMTADSSKQLTDRLATGTYSAILLLHVLDSGFETHGAMFRDFNLARLGAWVQTGGRMLVHGEGDLLGGFMQKLVGKPWHFCGDFYRHCEHACNFSKFAHFPLHEIDSGDTGAAVSSSSDDTSSDSAACSSGISVPRRINMKTVMLSGVAAEDRLYCPDSGSVAISGVPGFGGHIVPSDRVSVAVCTHGDGLFVFCGDANAEAKIVNLIASIVMMKM